MREQTVFINGVIVGKAEEIRDIVTDLSERLTQLSAIYFLNAEILDKVTDFLHDFFKHQ